MEPSWTEPLVPQGGREWAGGIAIARWAVIFERYFKVTGTGIKTLRQLAPRVNFADIRTAANARKITALVYTRRSFELLDSAG